MNMMDILRAAQGGNGIQNMARQHGLSAEQTEAVLAKVLPAMSAGFKQRAQSPDGFEQMLGTLQGTQYEDVYEDQSAFGRPDVADRGNAILGQIFGSKDVSRAVAQKAEFSSGVGSSIIKSMLPMIASMVLGGMQRRTSTNSGMGGILDMMLRGGSASRQQGGGGMADILGAVLGGGGGAGMGMGRSSGGGLQDILGQVLAGGAQSQSRGGGMGGGLGGILGGMLGGGGRQMPQQRGGGGLGGMLGGMLGGGARGRQSGGLGGGLGGGQSGGLGDIFGGQPQMQGRGAQSGGGIDDLLGGLLGSNPRQRQSTGDAGLDSVIGMFDSNGDGEVDYDVLRQMGQNRR